MARIYADAQGNLIRLLRNEDDERAFPDPPPGAAATLEFDEATNADVIAALNGERPGVTWQDHRLAGGVLTRRGQAVTINPPGEARQERERAQQVRQLLADYLDNPSPTGAQTMQALKALIRVVFWLWRRVGS